MSRSISRVVLAAGTGRALVVALACLLGFAGSAAAQQEARKLIMLDYVFMAEGHGLSDRDDYDAKVAPIVERHGIRRIASLDVIKVLRGPKGLARIDIWVLPDPAALGAWAKDPDYVAITEYRDRIHDMGRIALYYARPAGGIRALGSSVYLAEMQTFAATFDKSAFFDYVGRSDTLATQNEIVRTASFNVLKRLTRAGPKANWFNLWRLPSPKHFARWHRSEGFKALGADRGRLFDLSKSVFVLARSRR